MPQTWAQVLQMVLYALGETITITLSENLTPRLGQLSSVECIHAPATVL